MESAGGIPERRALWDGIPTVLAPPVVIRAGRAGDLVRDQAASLA